MITFFSSYPLISTYLPSASSFWSLSFKPVASLFSSSLSLCYFVRLPFFSSSRLFSFWLFSFSLILLPRLNNVEGIFMFSFSSCLPCSCALFMKLPLASCRSLPSFPLRLFCLITTDQTPLTPSAFPFPSCCPFFLFVNILPVFSPLHLFCSFHRLTHPLPLPSFHAFLPLSLFFLYSASFIPFPLPSRIRMCLFSFILPFSLHLFGSFYSSLCSLSFRPFCCNTLFWFRINSIHCVSCYFYFLSLFQIELI